MLLKVTKRCALADDAMPSVFPSTNANSASRSVSNENTVLRTVLAVAELDSAMLCAQVETAAAIKNELRTPLVQPSFVHAVLQNT